jgi:hypothetical protein
VYSKASTKFGLRLPKKVLTQLAEHQPDVLATQEQIEEIIQIGDHHKRLLSWKTLAMMIKNQWPRRTLEKV